MVFVNKRLGNGFRFKVADSSKDQEHYFTGAKKHVSLQMKFFSSSVNLQEKSDNFALTGTTGVELMPFLYDDAANFRYVPVNFSGNYFDYSNTFTGSYYSVGPIDVRQNVDSDPLGGNAAVYLSESTTATAFRLISKNISTAPDRVLTLSVFAKKLERDFIVLGLNTFAPPLGRVWYDLANGAIGTVQGDMTASITPAGDGWYRCSLSSRTNGGAGTTLLYMSDADGVIIYSGNAGTGSIAVFNHQLEDGHFSELFPTSGSSIDKSGIYPFSFNATTSSLPYYESKLTLRISASNKVFDKNDISIHFRDTRSDDWYDYRELSVSGAFFEEAGNWYRFEYRFSEAPLITSYTNDVECVVSCSSGNTYVFRDVGLKFSVPLTDGDTVQYRSVVDNQYIDFQNLNRNTMPDVEG